MEAQHQKLPSFFSKFAGSVMEKTNNDLNIRCFTKRQIESITNNYNAVLGKGGFSVVYKGRLDDGRPVAVKRYIFPSKKKEFTKEVIIQSQFSHRNIVSLLGCCVEADAPMLVTEFVPNGNLSDLLHGLTARGPLSLDKRLQIASDVAEALVYMHSQNHPILHGDIKPENIFLDNNYVPKLSDFGISRLLSVSSDEYTEHVIGSEGYIDPEFCQTGRLSTKSDVYSFGVVLLELMTRRTAIDDNKNLLTKKFGGANTKTSIHKLFDKEIATTENMKVLDDIVDLALKCVVELEERPEMRYVSERLRKIQRTREEKRRQKSTITSLEQNGFKRFISKEKINKMTNNFETNTFKCFMGKIYRGNAGEIPYSAIKLSFNVCGVLEFSDQMMLHSKVNHMNVVKFDRWCLDGDFPILVYESANASLRDILFGYCSEYYTFLPEERFWIAISIAEGLSYLHSLGIVHGDVRSANVLFVNVNPNCGPQKLNVMENCELYRKMRIKVSGIEASVYLSLDKTAHERIKAEASPKKEKRIKADEHNGYVDPRFLESGILTKEGDGYSLGVVLLELFTGEMASNHTRNCQLEELWDNEVCRHIAGTRTIIFRCLDPDIRKRPTLEEAIRVFRKEMDGIYFDRIDNCAARTEWSARKISESNSIL